MGDEALAIGAWEEARTAFQAALLTRESPECLEGLGMASWWLDLADLVFDSREHAYRLYLSRQDRRAAARMAVWLAWDCWAFRGESAIANGWLSRARRLLDGEPACCERAWLEMREAVFRLHEESDVDRALALAAEGIRLAEKAKEPDLEILGRSIQGLALVVFGSVPEGMRCLDEANTAVISGEITDLVIIGLTSCYLIAACERVRDYERAAEWCERLKAFSSKWGLRPLFAVCRTQYASLCIWRGTWLQAEQELCAAKEALAASRPAMAGDASVRLGELRRRQGRLAEARALFEGSLPGGASQLGLAAIALDNADAKSAVEYAQRYLECLKHYNATVSVKRGRAFLAAPTAALGVRALFGEVLDCLDDPRSPSKVCFMAGSLTYEVMEEADLRAYIEGQLSMLAERMKQRLTADKKAGLLKAELDPQVVVPVIITYLQGLWRMALISYERKKFEGQINLFLAGMGL